MAMTLDWQSRMGNNAIPDKFAYEAAPAIAAAADAKIAATAPDAAKLADEILARIERDRDYHGAAVSRDALIEVAVMCGCKRPDHS